MSKRIKWFVRSEANVLSTRNNLEDLAPRLHMFLLSAMRRTCKIRQILPTSVPRSAYSSPRAHPQAGDVNEEQWTVIQEINPTATPSHNDHAIVLHRKFQALNTVSFQHFAVLVRMASLYWCASFWPTPRALCPLARQQALLAPCSNVAGTVPGGTPILCSPNATGNVIACALRVLAVCVIPCVSESHMLTGEEKRRGSEPVNVQIA